MVEAHLRVANHGCSMHANIPDVDLTVDRARGRARQRDASRRGHTGDENGRTLPSQQLAARRLRLGEKERAEMPSLHSSFASAMAVPGTARFIPAGATPGTAPGGAPNAVAAGAWAPAKENPPHADIHLRIPRIK